MELKIYTSSFRTGENATKKQQMLFATDTAFALSEGYSFIKDCDGDLFQIIDEHNLLQVSEEDVLNQSAENAQDPILTSLDPEDCEGCGEEFCINCDNIDTIDLIIYDTLNQAALIRSSQLDSLIKLAKLKLLLGQCNG